MHAKVNHARVEFDAIPGNLGFARVAAASFAASLGFTVEELEDIKLAVSEAVSNCIVHAYPKSNSGPAKVRMNMETSESGVTISIEDTGVGIADIAAARTPGMTTDSQRLGMGFTLMEALANSLSVTSEPGAGTCVAMLFSPGRGG
ncbi:MAG: anti-sigma F factor [Firmicutes bacterium]|jgi:stage II sporulation protein AB (anti-sigma F factor)|nr:anti-sigma F factor [Bacillota bacterium]MDD4337128.1 anti-sigma F factor [Bacillota bacterium]MDD4793156.1 anti-sigma F factor [Bacillota bacterium]